MEFLPPKDLDEWTVGVMFLLHLYDGYSENFRLKEEVQLELNAVEACKNVRKTSKKFIILLMVKKIGQSCGV